MGIPAQVRIWPVCRLHMFIAMPCFLIEHSKTRPPQCVVDASLKECCKHHMQTICLLLHSQKRWILVSGPRNSSPVFPLFSQMLHVQWWGSLKTDPVTNGNSQGSAFNISFMPVRGIWCRKATAHLSQKKSCLVGEAQKNFVYGSLWEGNWRVGLTQQSNKDK